MRSITTWAAGLALTAACASTSSGEGASEPYAGEPDTPPQMESLPEPDVPVASMSERMQFAWLLTEQALELEDPPMPPRDAPMKELREWTTEELEPWLAKKNQLVEAARAELNLAAEERHRQRIVAGALVGLMYEDMARVLFDVPMPRELEGDPEIGDVYRDIVQFQASPYLEHARDAYRACSANATRPEGMHHWSSYCAGRLERLPAEEEPDHGETVVTVTVDE